MSDFGRKILFGDDNGKDFTNESLPKTRKKQFMYLVKTRLHKLFYINLLVLFFAIPLMLWHTLCLTYSFSFGEITVENIGEYIYFLIYYKSIPNVLLTILALLGIAGGLHTIRLISWGEPISLPKTFFRGIKLNLKQFSAIGLIFGIVFALYDLAVTMVSYSSGDSPFIMGLSVCGLLVSAIFMLSIAVYMLTLCSTYNIKFATALKSGIVLFVKNIFSTVKLLCITVLPSVVIFAIGNIYLDLIAQVILGLGGFSYSILKVSLYTNEFYDEYINIKDYPEFYRKGLASLDDGLYSGVSDVEN